MDLSQRPIVAPKLALLIDSENISHRCATAILTSARKFGDPVIRRAYGRQDQAEPWSAHGFRLCITAPGKNSADLLLSIEAMELALRDRIGTIILASSDGDFTCLAERLREAGFCVIGIGEAKAPQAFRAACTQFVLLAAAARAEPSIARKPASAGNEPIFDRVRNQIANAGPAGLKITALNTAVQQQGIRISEQPEKNWRRWLDKYALTFDLDAKGPDAVVRLRPPIPSPHNAP